jgi:Fe-S cluster assembly ATP-binding protein
MVHILEIKNLHANIEAKEILKGVDLVIQSGETHAIMGPNGSGKSTLALVLMGHPSYMVTAGEVLLDGVNLLEMAPDERSRLGMFLSFQDPSEVPGVSFFQFMRMATSKHRESETVENTVTRSKTLPVAAFKKEMQGQMEALHMGGDFLKRHLNTGFSGGEKKRAEMLQMTLLKPKFAILDEVDSGLDIDALKLVAKTVKLMANDERGILMITHYQRILNLVRPGFVHIFRDGQIVKTGGFELAEQLESQGYDKLNEQGKSEILEEVVG